MNKQKKVAVITMARNDEFFLGRWIKYYSEQFGQENLYIILDGLDQDSPKNAENVNIIKLEHHEMSRIAGDKYRITKLTDLAHELLKKYDLVIGCDCDEFLIADPKTGKSLAQYLGEIKIKTSVSGIGLDVGQNLNTESELNQKKPILEQREYALLSTRYTKPVVINRPVNWGSGFHRIKGHNFHLDKNLYLLHFGAVDLEMLKTKARKRGADWLNHLERRGNGTINAVTTKYAHGETFIKLARIMQRIFRPIYALDKPGMLGIKWVVRVPTRFIKTRI